jgi:PLAC8 family
MTRMSRDWIGGPGLRPSASRTCQIVTGIWLVVLLIQATMQIVMDSQGYCLGGQLTYDLDKHLYVILCPDGSINVPNSTYKATNWIAGLVGGCFALYTIFAICRTRQAIRKKYQIEAGYCGNVCEDCCCAFWCSCCTVSLVSLGCCQILYCTYTFALLVLSCSGPANGPSHQ